MPFIGNKRNNCWNRRLHIYQKRFYNHDHSNDSIGDTTTFWTTPPKLSYFKEQALIDRELERVRMADILEMDYVTMEGEHQRYSSEELSLSPSQANQNYITCCCCSFCSFTFSSSNSSESSVIVKVYSPSKDDYKCFLKHRSGYSQEYLLEDNSTGKEPTQTLHITKLVAPFDVQALKRQLEAFGPIVDGRFWITRTQCFVQFEFVQTAIRANRALHRRRWPPSSPCQLEVHFVDELGYPAAWRPKCSW